MSVRKYTLKYKTIISLNPNASLKESLETIFKDAKTVWHDYVDDNENHHNCVFEKYKLDDNYGFCRFGEIKESHMQNGVAFINDVEYENASFKYHVQFLIDYKKSQIVFVFNNNASCFEEAFPDFVSQKTNSLGFALEQIRADGLEEKIAKAKKIKFISLVKNNPDEFKPIFGSFYTDDLFETEIKLHLRKKKSTYRERVVDFVRQNKNDGQYSIAFTDEFGVDQLKKFTETIFFKTKKITIETEDINDKEKMFALLKENLENYE